MISVLPSPLFSILLTLFFSLFTALCALFYHFWKNETFDVKCGLNADHFSSLIRRHSTNFSNCGSACKHCTCWQPRCHNEFLLVGSINALHIKFQGWTFIATFSTAYQQGCPYVQKNLKLSLLKSGYSETVCPDQSENLQNCLSKFS